MYSLFQNLLSWIPGHGERGAWQLKKPSQWIAYDHNTIDRVLNQRFFPRREPTKLSPTFLSRQTQGFHVENVRFYVAESSATSRRTVEPGCSDWPIVVVGTCFSFKTLVPVSKTLYNSKVFQRLDWICDLDLCQASLCSLLTPSSVKWYPPAPKLTSYQLNIEFLL